jgi:7tm Chemosensory receptor
VLGGVIQITKYLRLVQFIISVNIINERLEDLDRQIASHHENSGTHSSLFSSFTSTHMFLKFENYRENFSKIWNLHMIVNEYFGMSNLFNIINISLSVAFNIYGTIISQSRNLSLLILVDPFQNISHVCILLIMMIATCRNSDKIVRVIA